MIKNDVRRDVGVDAGPVTSGFKVDISRGQRIGRVWIGVEAGPHRVRGKSL